MGSIKTPGSSPIRLAILEADKLQPQSHARFGGYTGMFTSLFASAAKTLDPPCDNISDLLTITGHDVVNDLNSYPSLDDVDAVLITGSHYTAHEDHPWILKLVEYTKQILDSGRVRVVGVCFGHQIIGRAVGAGAGRSDKGWELAVTDVDLTEKGKEIFQVDKLRIQQLHRDIVLKFPSDSTPLGSNAICEVQAMYAAGKYITVQGHPEFSQEIISEIFVNRHKAGVFDDVLFADAMKRAQNPHDSLPIARAFLKFMREG